MFLLFWYTFIINVFCVPSSPNVVYLGSGKAADAAAGYYREVCEAVQPVILSEVLGPAFNSRYMSFKKPVNIIETTVQAAKESWKRGTQEVPSFYVDDNYASELSDIPAWEVTYSEQALMNPASDSRGHRRKRFSQLFDVLDRPWECESKILWIDLGLNYFPRFLRSVECEKRDCWYSHYCCQPRSFTVKILRKKDGTCVNSNPLRKIGISGLPDELLELWVWEERAVNFCCVCALQT